MPPPTLNSEEPHYDRTMCERFHWEKKPGQQALSAKRCIKTQLRETTQRQPSQVARKHRAPKGALRRVVARIGLRHDRQESKSTERQKVH